MYSRKFFYVWLTTRKRSLIPTLFHVERRNEPVDKANANVTSCRHGILPRPNVLHITQDTAQRIWSWNKICILANFIQLCIFQLNSQLSNATKPVLQRKASKALQKVTHPSTLWPEGVWVSETNYVHKYYFCTAVQLVISNIFGGVWISENSKLIM